MLSAFAFLELSMLRIHVFCLENRKALNVRNSFKARKNRKTNVA